MATKSKNAKRLEPKKYHSMLKQIELCEIFLESSTTELKRELFELHKKNFEVSIRDKASYEQNNDRLNVKQKYTLTVHKPESKKDFVIKITASFCLLFSSEAPIGKEFFDIFQEINLPLNSWPYFREFTQNMFQRMNVPPLTLPFIKRG